MIEPIDSLQRQQVSDATLACLKHAESLFELKHRPIDIRFDLKGRAAGMYRVHLRQRVIRYNPYIFARYFEHGLEATVPHEVAHYVTDRLFGLGHIRPHGREWQTVMRALGAEPHASAKFDLEGIPQRRQRRYAYQCDCTTHQLSACRHNKITSGKARYHCRLCGSVLVENG